MERMSCAMTTMPAANRITRSCTIVAQVVVESKLCGKDNNGDFQTRTNKVAAIILVYIADRVVPSGELSR
jgi:hypothetical protein